jgi:hypothetical protein
MARRIASLIVATSLLGACGHEESILPPAGEGLARGTWGGDNAGVLVGDTAHLHVACTFGNFARPTVLDEDGRFSVAGSYVLRAYPVQVGPELPAQFAGVVSGGTLTISVAVNDTVEKKLVAVGPVTVTFAREPHMQQCPICRTPETTIAP